MNMWSRKSASSWQKGTIKAFGHTKSLPIIKFSIKKMAFRIKVKTEPRWTNYEKTGDTIILQQSSQQL